MISPILSSVFSIFAIVVCYLCITFRFFIVCADRSHFQSINLQSSYLSIMNGNMTEEEKSKLIDAVNCKFPHNNIMELYYNIGRALPFTAQRFPDGRVSDWYRSQYVQVVKVMPHGKYGKYGKAFGFYYRNGERADSSDIEGLCWCKKEDQEPQEIPNSGCGSWMLLDIQGEPSTDNPKVLGLDDVIDFGKYKGVTIREVIEKDWQYIEWAVLQSQRLYVDVEAVVSYHESCIVSLKPSDVMQFGKYKGQSLASVYATDAQYLRWLESNNDSFRIDWDSFQTQIQNCKDE